MKTTKEMIEVMRSCDEGEQIQFCFLDDNSIWEDVDGVPIWNWIECDYRVKPRKRLVPFETAEDLIAVQRVKGNKVEHKVSGRQYEAFVNYMGDVLLKEDEYIHITSLKSLCIDYIFPNSTPCGKEVIK